MVSPLVVGSAVVVVNSVVVSSVVVVEATVVVDAVMLCAVVMLKEAMEEGVVAPGLECVLEAVASLRGGAPAVVPRPVVAIGRLAADGLVSGLLDGEDRVVDSWMVVLLVKVEVRAGSVVTVGRATPGARCGDGAWGGNKVAEATRAARTAKLSPKATSKSLQGRRALARCRGDRVGMCIVPVRLLLPG